MKTASPFSQRITYDVGRIGTQTAFPGVAGNYLSVPDAALLHIAGDVEVVARMTRRSSTANGDVFTIDGTPRGWRFHITSAAQLVLTPTLPTGAAASTTLPGTGDDVLWVRCTRVAATGAIAYFSASDGPTEPTTWTARGTATSTAGPLGNPATSVLVSIGARGAGGSAEPFGGRIARVIVRDGIAGTTVLDVDERNIPTDTATTFTATTGQTVTVVGDPLGGELTGLLPHRPAPVYQARSFAPIYRGPR